MFRYGDYRIFEDEEDFRSSLTDVKRFGGHYEWQIGLSPIREEDFPKSYPAVICSESAGDMHYRDYCEVLSPKNAAAIIRIKMKEVKNELKLNQWALERLDEMQEKLEEKT